jgi:hypothetical protein
MAGMSTDTGTERCSVRPRPPAPVVPAAAAGGCGACTWAMTATAAAVSPPAMSRTASSPAIRARRLTAGCAGSSGPAADQDITTRKPAIRRPSASPMAADSLTSAGSSTRVA